MISKKMIDRLNVQLNHEHHNAWSYLAMAYWFETAGLRGFAKFFHKQAGEERGHGEKIARYLLDQGAPVVLDNLEKPKNTYKNALEAVETFLQLEMKTTKMVHEIVALAEQEKDYATRQFIQWKVGEQVEEEATANAVLQLVKAASTDAQLLMIEGRILELMGK